MSEEDCRSEFFSEKGLHSHCHQARPWVCFSSFPRREADTFFFFFVILLKHLRKVGVLKIKYATKLKMNKPWMVQNVFPKIQVSDVIYFKTVANFWDVLRELVSQFRWLLCQFVSTSALWNVDYFFKSEEKNFLRVLKYKTFPSLPWSFSEIAIPFLFAI